MQLPRAIASSTRDAIVSRQPFADRADFVARVNAGAKPQQCVGRKLLTHFNFALADDAAAQPPRTRNAEYARELFGLFVYVPWSAWDGYENASVADCTRRCSTFRALQPHQQEAHAEDVDEPARRRRWHRGPPCAEE